VTTIADVDDLVELVERGAAVTDAEPVDLLAHALQTAAALAERAPDDHELQAAGLVHDIGWLLGAGADEHASVGAAAVGPVLGPRVARLVQQHVIAKRYLVAVDPDYMLSDRSRSTLMRQGGPLDEVEIDAFADDPEASASVCLRRADDGAKEPGLVVAGIDRWRPVLEALAPTR